MRRVLCCAVLSLIPALACAQQAGLPPVQLLAGIHRIEAEVARTQAQRETGLMGRRFLPTNHGMLFVFESDRNFCMWMKNTPLPLSVAFIADDGGVVNVADMLPQTLDTHCSARPVRFALEMPAHWFASHGIGPGFKLQGAPFAAR